VDDLAAWLTQVWDEQEKMVQAAIDDDGGQDGGFEDEFDRLTRGRKIAGPTAFEPSFGEACARMIVANTPKLALARIAADRQILALHSGGEWHPHRCPICVREQDHDDDGVWYPVYESQPCPTVRLLAQPYADRPGFRDEWRVTA
jgi:hypothetical protein